MTFPRCALPSPTGRAPQRRVEDGGGVAVVSVVPVGRFHAALMPASLMPSLPKLRVGAKKGWNVSRGELGRARAG